MLLVLLHLFQVLAGGSSPLPAFPGAYGAGAYTPGGRGGEVVHVTNLNDSGPGSFREALGGSNRIIVFDVAGVIQVQSRLTLGDQRYVTIAGQTAPAGGITVQGTGNFVSLMLYNCEHVVMRYIRVRGGTPQERDALQVYNGANIILDHVSVSYGSDEAFSVTGSDPMLIPVVNVTVQRTLFAASKTGVILGGTSAVMRDISFNHNCFVDMTHRFPNAAGVGASSFEVINNVVHNWKFRLMAAYGPGRFNHINNYAQNGALGQFVHLNKLTSSQASSASIYTSGTIIAPTSAPNAVTDPNSDNRILWQEYTQGTTPVSTAFFTPQQWPLFGNPTPILSATEALADVPTNVGANARLDETGAWVEEMDSLDTAWLNTVVSNSAVTYSSDPSVFDKTVPPIVGGQKSTDSNNDGIPDAWKLARGFGVMDNLSQMVFPSGYVGIEEFINGSPSDASTIAASSMPTTQMPSNAASTGALTTQVPSNAASTGAPTTQVPSSAAPTGAPTTLSPSSTPTTASPTLVGATPQPTTRTPTLLPTTLFPTDGPTTLLPSTIPTTASPTLFGDTPQPTTLAPTVLTSIATTDTLPTVTQTTSAATLPIGAIIGGAIGGVIVLAAVTVGIILCYRHVSLNRQIGSANTAFGL